MAFRRHRIAAETLWKTLEDREQIYQGFYEGWYSVRDETYYKVQIIDLDWKLKISGKESELVNGKAPTGADVEWVVKEPSYFFKLSEWTQVYIAF